MNDPLPPVLSYAGPSSDPSVPEIFALGPEYIALRRGSEFPRRCLYCNAEEVGKAIRVRLKFVPRSVSDGYAGNRTVPLIGPIILAAKCLEFSLRAQRASVDVYLCAIHRRARLLQFVFWWSLWFFGATLLTAGIVLRVPLLAMLGVLSILIPLIVRNLYPWLLKAILINDQHFILDGAGVLYLQSLPQKPLVKLPNR